MEALRGLLTQAIADGTCTDASLAVVRDGELFLAIHASGRERVYDIASVTKAFTAAAVLRALAPDTRVAWVDGAPTVADLLAHASGLPAWRPLFALAARVLGTPPADLAASPHRSDEVRAHYRRLIAATSADAPRPTYSDLGFLALGLALEEETGLPLADHMAALDAHVSPRPSVATGHGRPRAGNPDVEGEVVAGAGICPDAVDAGPDDDNAACAGGLCGHAGLFATAAEVARFGDRLRRDAEDGTGGLVDRDLAVRMFTREAGSRTLGLDTPSGALPSIGTLLGRGPMGAAGHLGFSGCSLWIDRDARLSIALLSNAVACARPNPRLKAWRPAVHDAVARALTPG